MLHGFETPLYQASVDNDPAKSPAEKLAIIKASLVTAHHMPERGKFSLSLPYTTTSEFYYSDASLSKELYVGWLGVGDHALARHGIGGRILRSAVRYALTLDPTIDTLRGDSVQLAGLNTVTQVLGSENVQVSKAGTLYGPGGRYPLEDLLEDYPPSVGRGYTCEELVAHIDASRTAQWEMPVVAPA